MTINYKLTLFTGFACYKLSIIRGMNTNYTKKVRYQVTQNNEQIRPYTFLYMC